VERAVDRVVEEGARTADLTAPGQRPLTTAEMGERVVRRIRDGRGAPHPEARVLVQPPVGS
jgi:hypothetical protein